MIPALNEEEALGHVIQDLKRTGYRTEIIVCDNGSTDQTVKIAKQHMAKVVQQPIRGYGAACLKAIAAMSKESDVVVFIDADYSDDPSELPMLVQPIIDNKADFVIGTRNKDKASSKSIPIQARLGNKLAVSLVALFWGTRYQDLGPFRAIKKDKLLEMNMHDIGMGWTIEMQIKAVINGLRIKEIPVSYRPRIGSSKISGTISGSIAAGYGIIKTILRYRLTTLC